MHPKETTSPLTTLFEWLLAIIGITLLIRFALLAFNLLFNFAETPLGRLIHEGVIVEQVTARLLSASPWELAIQVGILLVVAALLTISKLRTASDELGAAGRRE